MPFPEDAGILSLNGAIPPYLPETYTFLENTTVTFSASPVSGYRFTGWSSENLTLELSGNSYGSVNVSQ